MAARTYKVVHVLSLSVADLLALLEGMKLAFEIDTQCVIQSNDSLNAVHNQITVYFGKKFTIDSVWSDVLCDMQFTNSFTSLHVASKYVFCANILL